MVINMNIEIFDCLDEISNEFLNQENVKEYKKLNQIVQDKYAKEIIIFESAREKLQEMKKYSKDLKVYEQNLIEAKTKLYSYPEVKRLKELEKILNDELISLSNDIASHLSNKFKEKRGI